jgi:hypothetical protein
LAGGWARVEELKYSPTIGCVVFLAMAAVAYSRHYQRFYLETARYACIGISIGGAVEVAHRQFAGHDLM